MSSFKTKSYSIKINNNIKKEVDKLKSLQQNTIRVGVIGSKTNRQQGEITNASLLYLHTWGSFIHNIPARPVLDAIEIKINEFDKDTQHVMKKFLQNTLNALTTARQIGAIALQYILMSFETKGFGRWAELKSQTIKAKNSSAILIDTGELRRSLTFDVVEK